ncbi:MAG: hypothetical protein R3A80_02760 [Bdellovibrionota bacterium]
MTFSKKGFSAAETLIAVGVLGLFSVILGQVINFQSNQKKVAEIKASMNQLLTHSRYAAKRYELFYLESYLADPAQAGLKDCFKSKGINCEAFNVGRPDFPPSDPNAAQLNAMLRGNYSLEGETCNAATCPITVSAEWEIICTSNACSGIKFLNRVDINSSAIPTGFAQVATAIPSIESEFMYSTTKQVGIVRALASSCPSATGVNFDTGSVDCSPVNGSGSTSNKLFNLALGYGFQNTDARLVATAGGSSSTSSVSSCPAGTVATMEGDAIVCSDEPTLLCSNAGWIVKNGQCCNPVIPDGGDGWGAWGACSVTCGTGGTQTRSCAYPKQNYCDSACNAGETSSQACSGKPYATNNGWGGYGGCVPNNGSCGAGLQTRYCAQPQSSYCSSSCNSGDSSQIACNGPACTCSNGASNWPACSVCSGGCFKMHNGSKRCRPQKTENDNGGSGKFSSNNQTRTYSYQMGSWDQTEYAGASTNRCSVSVTYDGSEMDPDKVKVTCKGNNNQSYSFQLRRKTCD